MVENEIGHRLFEQIISLENLVLAWQEFKRGKIKKTDVQQFSFNLEDNLFRLHDELRLKTYQHDQYSAFSINDPKPRRIHKASVGDRVLHQAVFRVLYQIFDKHFIFDSYSCRLGKGTHRAVSRLEGFLRKVSRNHSRTAYVLKCDVRKFFDSVDQQILGQLIEKKIQDQNAIWLIRQIIGSFEKTPGKGLPLGNVTSQLFANVYLSELDQFVKHSLKARHYIRYCDDFVIVHKDQQLLRGFISVIADFLKNTLKLQLHPDKVFLRKHRQGIDFLGYVVLPYHRVLRTKTKARMFKRARLLREQLLSNSSSTTAVGQSLSSYFGLLKHCNSYRLRRVLVFCAFHDRI